MKYKLYDHFLLQSLEHKYKQVIYYQYTHIYTKEKGIGKEEAHKVPFQNHLS